jgi:hypothetical protein
MKPGRKAKSTKHQSQITESKHGADETITLPAPFELEVNIVNCRIKIGVHYRKPYKRYRSGKIFNKCTIDSYIYPNLD